MIKEKTKSVTFLGGFSTSSNPTRVRIGAGASKNWTSKLFTTIRVAQIIVHIIIIDPFPFLAFSRSISSQNLQLFLPILNQWSWCCTWQICLQHVSSIVSKMNIKIVNTRKVLLTKSSKQLGRSLDVQTYIIGKENTIFFVVSEVVDPRVADKMNGSVIWNVLESDTDEEELVIGKVSDVKCSWNSKISIPFKLNIECISSVSKGW